MSRDRHILYTSGVEAEGGVDRAGISHKLVSFDDGHITEVFSREVLRFLET
jgi:hypothetical protein